MISFIYHSWNHKIIEVENKWVVVKGFRWWGGEGNVSVKTEPYEATVLASILVFT